MKELLTALVVCFISISSSAQEPTDAETVKIFRFLIPNRENDWLQRGIDSSTREFNDYWMLQNQYYRRYTVNDIPQRDTLSLTNAEKDTIAYQINLQKKKKWTIKRMKQLGLSNFMLSPVTEQPKAAIKNKSVYTITEPVFFRNNTFCFVYRAFQCGGLCGLAELAILEKVAGEWNYWEVIYTTYD